MTRVRTTRFWKAVSRQYYKNTGFGTFCFASDTFCNAWKDDETRFKIQELASEFLIEKGYTDEYGNTARVGRSFLFGNVPSRPVRLAFLDWVINKITIMKNQKVTLDIHGNPMVPGLRYGIYNERGTSFGSAEFSYHDTRLHQYVFVKANTSLFMTDGTVYLSDTTVAVFKPLN